jgi:exosortase A
MMRDSIERLVVPGVDGAPRAVGRTWQIASAALAVAIMWVIAWYWTTGAGMVGIWIRSETFAHGFIVAPITLWLVWRKRAEIARVAPRPSWWVVPLIAAAGFGWLLGELGAVNAVSQFAFVALLVLAVPAVLGVGVARTIAFPLAFLFFAVPVGEFVMPQLMQWTADFTVKAIQLTGIPIYREGQSFIIPSGRWAVVEACSGVRYLIASVVIGTLYAYLTYRSLRRRLMFIGVSILVPIVANWVRAYMIVMIGHLSGNVLAGGVDHLIYGWVFFGFVILLMFWAGGRWREDDVAIASPPRALVSRETGSPGEFLLVTAALAVATAVWPLGYRAIEHSDSSPVPSLHALATAGSWTATSGGLTTWEPRYQMPSAQLHQTFRRGEARVGLYVGYYRNQDQGRKLVNSENVLVVSNDPVWLRVGGGTQPVEGLDRPFNAASTELLARSGDRLVVWHWYWIDGRMTSSDAWAKGYSALSRLLGRGDDGAVIVVYAPKERPGEAEAALSAFVREVGPAVLAELRRARDER